MTEHEFPEMLIAALRRGADDAAPGAWTTLYAVVYDTGDSYGITATAFTPDGQVDPAPPPVVVELAQIADDWLDTLAASERPAWRAVLLRSDRVGGDAAVQLLHPDAPGVESWEPTPSTFHDIIRRLPGQFGRTETVAADAAEIERVIGPGGAVGEAAPASPWFTSTTLGTGPKFRIQALPQFKDTVLKVVRLFAEHGEMAQPGLVMDYGWGVFMLEADGEGYRVLAPTYANMHGIEWGHDAVAALWLHEWQLATCAKAGLAPADCRYFERMLVDPRAVTAKRLVLSRVAPAGSEDSGWRLGVEGESVPAPGSAGVRAMPTHLLAHMHRHLARALRLPVGVTVTAHRERIERVTGPNGDVLLEGPW